MKLGIRAQVVMALGGLLVLAITPLFFVIANLARVSMTRSWESSARALGRSVAGHVSAARSGRSGGDLQLLIDAQLGEAVGAVKIYGRDGKTAFAAGASGVVEHLPDAVEANQERTLRIVTARGAAIGVVVPDQAGAVGVLLHTDPKAIQVAPLVRLVALYMGLLGLALLVFSYAALTRIVVTPVERLSHAASRVAGGARDLEPPRRGGRELIELGRSLSQMTTTLRAEEEKLRSKIAEVEAAHEELREAQSTLVRSERLASVGRLSAGLAHEIGNPLTSILSFQELLLDGELDEDQRDFIERMQRETQRVHGILRDLLDFARPGAKGIEEVDETGAAYAVDVVDQVLSLLRPQKDLRDVAIDADVEDGVPPIGMRPEQLEQVLLNLLLNASQVVPKPGGEVALRVFSDQGEVRIEVEDNGGGIAPSVRERLFEPFVTTKDVGEGTGLGLAVCRGLVEAIGGTIDVEDGDSGARFVMQLPVARRSMLPGGD